MPQRQPRGCHLQGAPLQDLRVGRLGPGRAAAGHQPGRGAPADAGRLVAAAGAVDAAAVAGGAARRVRCAAAAAGPGTGAGPQRPEPGTTAPPQPGAAWYRPEPGRGDRPLAERLPRTAPALGVDAGV